MDMQGFGERIRTLRIQQGLTQQELGERLGVTAQAVSKWENGLAAPDIGLLVQLAAVLRVSMDELFGLASPSATLPDTMSDAVTREAVASGNDLHKAVDAAADEALAEMPDEMSAITQGGRSEKLDGSQQTVRDVRESPRGQDTGNHEESHPFWSKQDMNAWKQFAEDMKATWGPGPWGETWEHGLHPADAERLAVEIRKAVNPDLIRAKVEEAMARVDKSAIRAKVEEAMARVDKSAIRASIRAAAMAARQQAQAAREQARAAREAARQERYKSFAYCPECDTHYPPTLRHCPECHDNYRLDQNHCKGCHENYRADEQHCPGCHENYDADEQHCPGCHENYDADEQHCMVCHENYDADEQHCLGCHENYANDEQHCPECHGNYADDERHCPGCHENYADAEQHCTHCHVTYDEDEAHCARCHMTYDADSAHRCPEQTAFGA